MMFRASTIIKLCLMFLSVELVSCDWKPNNKVRETLCDTAECKARGDEYKKNLNNKVSPCHDFYSFACGNWQKSHPGPRYASQWSILYELNFEIFKVIRNILESNNFDQDDDDKFAQTKMIYDHCIKIPQYPIHRDAKDIAREIGFTGRVPAALLWNIHLTYLRLTGESAFFRSILLTNPLSKHLPMLMVLEPHSAYGSIYHEDTWKPQEKQAYTEFLFLIMKSLKLKGSDKVIKEGIEKVFLFREKLNRIIRQNKRKHADPVALYTGQKLDNHFSQTLGQMTSSQKLLWKEVVEVLLQNVSPDKRQTREIIAMRQKGYFFELMDLLKETPEEVIASHMEIYFVETHLKLEEKMYKLLEATSVEPHSFYSYIRIKYYPRWYKCLEELNMKTTFEKLLYQKWFPKDYADIIPPINDRIKSAIVDQMKKSTWLDKSTSDETARRINNVEEWIGFPPWIDGVGSPSILRMEEDILTAQAYLTRGSNVLYVQAPLLLPPMFSPTIPDIYNYAGIGFTLGHELYHVMNDCGQYDLYGSKIVWWEPRMRTECIKRKNQFIREYNILTDRELQKRYNIGLKSDTAVSVLENIPDVMGLQAAFKAYKDLALQEKSTCQTLPNFEKYSCDQMFYIAFANTYCGFKSKKSAERRILEKTTHSLDCIRVNGAVSQMQDFGTAFGCQAGARMNPVEKLDLWK